jgi:SAM-dependent methyltransferase
VTGAALVVQGDALHLPLPDASVDLCVTSPPYWALRAYSAGPGEIGSEPTPAEYLEALWAATAEMMRVLKPTGSAFIDLGDKYNSAQSGQNGANLERTTTMRKLAEIQERGRVVGGIPAKSLMLLPERYRVGCVDQTSDYYRAQFYQQLADDLMDGETTPERARQLADEFEASPKSKGLGLIARAVIVWNKPNGLPESVTDRVRRSHEDWVHLVREPRYYSATDEVREPYSERMQGWSERYTGRDVPARPYDDSRRDNHRAKGIMGFNNGGLDPLGKLPGSVWTIPSEPLRLPEHLGVQHYAAFPSEWPRRLILGWSPPGICLECGAGRVPVVERENDAQGRTTNGPKYLDRSIGGNRREVRTVQAATILGYACSCTPFTSHRGKRGDWKEGREESAEHLSDDWHSSGNAVPRRPGGFGTKVPPPEKPMIEYHLDGWRAPPTRPAIVLDPFGGTGTVAMVARALGRIGVSVDLSMPYCRAARWRVHHDAGKAISRTWVERQGQLL